MTRELLDLVVFSVFCVGAFSVVAWLVSLVWPRPPHVCRAVLYVRRCVLVDCEADMLVTCNDEGEYELADYAIMPRAVFEAQYEGREAGGAR